VPRLVQRADAQLRSSEGWAPHALTEIRDIKRPAVAIGEHPRTMSFAHDALGAERLLDDGQHPNITL
jgi:hypothetical protein